MTTKSARAENVFKIPAFTGINIDQPSDRIADTEATELINFDLNAGGHLTRRNAVAHYSILPSFTNLLGHFTIDAVGFFLSTSATTLYKSLDGITWTTVGTLPSGTYAIQYANIVYIVTGSSGLYKYDGTTLSAISSTPSGTCIGVFKDRLFILNSSIALNSRLYFSNALDPDTWAGTNFIDINTGDGEFLTALYPINDKLLIFKNQSVWSLFIQGSPINWILRLTRRDIGCIAVRSLVELDGSLYFLDKDAIYRTDGFNFVDISMKIKKRFLSDLYYLSFNAGAASKLGKKYIIHINGGAIPGFIVYDTEVNGWSEWTFADRNVESHVINVFDGFSSSLYFVTYFSSNYHLVKIQDPKYGIEQGYDENSIPIPVSYKSKTYNYSKEFDYKRGKQYNLYMDLLLGSEDDVIGVTYTTEDHSETFELTNIEIAKSTYKVKGPGFFKTIQFTIACDNPFKFDIYAHELLASLKGGFANQGSYV